MPRICPRCRAEYRESALVCADCGMELVDEAPQSTQGITMSRVTEARLEPAQARQRLLWFRIGAGVVFALAAGMTVGMIVAGQLSDTPWWSVLLGAPVGIVFFVVLFYWAYWGYASLWDRYGGRAWSGLKHLAATRKVLLALLVLTSPAWVIAGLWASWIVVVINGLLGGATRQYVAHLAAASQPL